MASYLSEERIRPGLILCSTAVRATETLEGVGLSDDALFERELYGASAGELLARIRRLPDEVESAMLVGHNPGMHDLALRLGGTGDVERKFPTGALATFEVAGAWSTLDAGGAELTDFVRPKQLG